MTLNGVLTVLCVSNSAALGPAKYASKWLKTDLILSATEV